MKSNFGQIQYRIIEGQINFEKFSYNKEKPLLTNKIPETSDPKTELEKKLREEMRRLSIKYFKGREYNKNKTPNYVDEYINDMKNFVKNYFPDYNFFLCVVTTTDNNSFWIDNKHLLYSNTDGWIKEIYKDKISCFSYLMYIKKRNYDIDISLKDLQNNIRPKMKKIINNYLEGRKYEHKEFQIYVEGIGKEINREIHNLSKKVCCNNLVILMKKPTNGYSFRWNWLNGKNVEHFVEKYDGQFSKCLAILGYCIP